MGEGGGGELLEVGGLGLGGGGGGGGLLGVGGLGLEEGIIKMFLWVGGEGKGEKDAGGWQGGVIEISIFFHGVAGGTKVCLFHGVGVVCSVGFILGRGGGGGSGGGGEVKDAGDEGFGGRSGRICASNFGLRSHLRRH